MNGIQKTYLVVVLIVCVIFYFATTAILFIPSIPVVEGSNLNWQGKLLSCMLALLFIYLMPFLTPKEVGFTFNVNSSVWIPFLIFLWVSVTYSIFDSGGISNVNTSTEYIIYQLTMPGISEELIFRGVLLGLFNLVFVSRKRILGVSVGWGSLIQAVIFGAWHAIYFDGQQHLQFIFESFIVSFILGIFMTYLRIKGESLIPAILFHNLFNAAIPILQILF